MVCALIKDAIMIRKAIALVLFGVVVPFSVAAEDSLVRFEGGIGVIPAAPQNTNPQNWEDNQCASMNCVFNTIPPVRYPRVIKELSVDVKRDGRISVVGRGLLSAGGGNIGTPRQFGELVSLFASLFCSDNMSSRYEYQSDSVSVDLNGDFRIESLLKAVSPAPLVPPAPCENAVLLLREANSNLPIPRWFAAGIPKR